MTKGFNIGPYGADGVFGKYTKKAVIDFQSKNNLKPDGVVGPCTAKALGVESMQGGNVCNDQKIKPVEDRQKTKDKEIKTKYDCIGVSKEICSRLTKSGGVINKGQGDEGCAQYVRICLSELDNKISRGDAWRLLSMLKHENGKEIYNMFTSGDIDYKKLVSNLNAKNGTKKCQLHISEGGGKDDKDPTFRNEIKAIYPNKSGVSIPNLKLGDIVGMYYNKSGNFGKAFCQRALKDGRLTEGPYSFNTHVGFVGAIKDGEPLIFHSIHGTRYATPASKMLNKSGEEMITWVVRDPEVYNAVYSPTKDQSLVNQEKPWWKNVR